MSHTAVSYLGAVSSSWSQPRWLAHGIVWKLCFALFGLLWGQQLGAGTSGQLFHPCTFGMLCRPCLTSLVREYSSTQSRLDLLSPTIVVCRVLDLLCQTAASPVSSPSLACFLSNASEHWMTCPYYLSLVDSSLTFIVQAYSLECQTLFKVDLETQHGHLGPGRVIHRCAESSHRRTSNCFSQQRSSSTAVAQHNCFDSCLSTFNI